MFKQSRLVGPRAQAVGTAGRRSCSVPTRSESFRRVGVLNAEEPSTRRAQYGFRGGRSAARRGRCRGVLARDGGPGGSAVAGAGRSRATATSQRHARRTAICLSGQPGCAPGISLPLGTYRGSTVEASVLRAHALRRAWDLGALNLSSSTYFHVGRRVTDVWRLRETAHAQPLGLLSTDRRVGSGELRGAAAAAHAQPLGMQSSV